MWLLPNGNVSFLSSIVECRVFWQPTHGLFDGGIVVVELAAQQAEPLLELQDAVIHVVAGTTLNDEDTLVGEVLGQPAGNDTASSATTDDDVVVVVDIAGGEFAGSDGSGSHVE